MIRATRNALRPHTNGDTTATLNSVASTGEATAAAPAPVVESASMNVNHNTLSEPLHAVPQILKDIPNWVSWKLIGGETKAEKVPFISGTPYHASTTDPRTWTNFEKAISKATINHSEGLGFVVGGSTLEKRIVGVDLDGCYDSATDTLAPWAEKIINLLDSYTEKTPSGSGLRVWVIGDWPFGNRFEFDLGIGYGPKVGVEVYNIKRYFTVTGDAWFDEQVPVESRDLSALHDICLEIHAQHPRTKENGDSIPNSESNGSVQIQREGSVVTDKYELLMRGTVSGDKPLTISDGLGNTLEYADRSAADLALCTASALKHGDNPDAIWSDYLQSSLARPKWENREESFRSLTIAKAITSALEIRQSQTKVSDVVAPTRPPWVDEAIEDSQNAIAQATNESVPDASVEDMPWLATYDMTPEEIAIQDAAEYPVYKLKRTPGPDFNPAHLYGVLGQIAKRMCACSEAHLATVYLNLMVSFGNMIGRGPYFNVNDSTLYTNEFLACVGLTASGRKGLAADLANALLSIVEANWLSNRNCGGFASRQAVISEIKDDSVFQRLDAKTGTYKSIVQPGIEDKRLCIRESELSNLFKLMSDAKTKTAELIRDMWDSKPLSNLVAGKTEAGEHNSLVCEEPHGSIIGTTTPSLARTTMPFDKDTSGDANRFLFCYTKRTQICPMGGPRIEWATETLSHDGADVPLLAYLCETVSLARQVGLVTISNGARNYWNRLYQRFEGESKKGFLGGMTTRAAAHIRKVAMILALMDREDEIGRDHLEAAEAIWDYSIRSVQYIFTYLTTDGARIAAAAEKAGKDGMTVTDVHALFNRHRTAEWVQTELNDLVSNDILTSTKEQRAGANGQLYDVIVFRFKRLP